MSFMLAIADQPIFELALPALIALVVFLIVFRLSRRSGVSKSLSLSRAASAPQSSARKNGSTVPSSRASQTKPPANASVAGATADHEPWFLLLGPRDSGKTAVLSGLRKAFFTHDRTWVSDLASGIARWHFAAGEVLEVAGNLFAPSVDNIDAQKAWKDFVTRLQRQRPRRPVDGVILAVPSTHLAGDHALSAEDLELEAGHAARQLKMLRDQLGFCLPVYIVVTKCDTVPGYKTFVGVQMATRLNEIFGWSNPYNLDAPFDPQWTSQAFTEVYRELSRRRVEFFTRPADSASRLRDDLFLFPSNLQKLESPLATWLQRLFQESGHRDALQFRGIYFSGSATQATEAFEDIHDDDKHAHGGGFTSDLFEQKIFPERSLARPVETEYAHRSAEVTVTRWLCVAAALLLFPGAFLGWRSLSQSSRKVIPYLQQIRDGLGQAKDHPAAPPAYAAIYAAQGLSGSNFESWLLPASIPASLDQQVREIMPPVFNQMVYPGLKADLEQRTATLVSPPESSPAQGEIVNVSASNAVQRLEAFTDSLLELENNIVLFNRTAPAGQGSGKDLLQISASLAPAVFNGLNSRDTSGLDTIVRGSSGTLFDGHPWNAPAAERLETLVTDVLRQSVDEEQIIASLDTLVNRINLLEENKLETYEQLQSLLQSLDQVQKQLAAPDLQWIARSGDQFQAPDALNKSLNRIFSRPAQQNILLCDEASGQAPCANLQQVKLSIEQMARAHLAELRQLLLSAETATTGKLVVTTDAKLQLSKSAASLQTVLDNFLKLPFVAHEGTAEPREVEPGMQLFWDNDRLQAAIQDKQAYDKFFESQLANTPQNLQDTFEEVALSRLDANMLDAIASAQRFEPLPSGDQAGPATTNEVRAFQAASQSLDQILGQFSELNFDEDYQDLANISSGHALAMLARIDRSFEARKFYWPSSGNFDRWTGDAPPSAAVYGKNSADDMAAYLVSERQSVQQYVVSAQPLVTYLQQHGSKTAKPSPLVAKWQNIANDLQKHESAPAASGIGSVEDFLGVNMDKIAVPECQIPASQVNSSLIYFVQVRRSLAQALVSRCRSLAGQSASQQYNQLADFFNQKLAGRFPFVSASDAGSGPGADPADIIELYHQLDANGGAVRVGLQSASGASGSTAKMSEFVNQLDALRPLFASLLSGQPGAMPVFDTTPAFRVNRNHEVNGNQIIDWSLQIGGDTFRNSDPPSTHLIWNYGDPVKLTLRWAKDSPQQPVPVAPATGISATRTVVFEYRDPWSLLRMLVQHAAPPADFDRGVDPDPQTLVFTAGQETNGEPGKEAKVYIRVRIYAPGKTDALRIPPFPQQAPLP